MSNAKKILTYEFLIVAFMACCMVVVTMAYWEAMTFERKGLEASKRREARERILYQDEEAGRNHRRDTRKDS